MRENVYDRELISTAGLGFVWDKNIFSTSWFSIANLSAVYTYFLCPIHEYPSF